MRNPDRVQTATAAVADALSPPGTPSGASQLERLGATTAINLSKDVNVTVRVSAIEKEASIVAGYSDNALVRSARKVISSIEKHLGILEKAPPDQVKSITEDLKKAATRLEAIRAEQAKRLADAAR